MKIVIAGAGGIGFHLAKLLSSAQHDIILIDDNKDVLEYVQSHLDVKTILGNASSIDILQEADVHRATLFLAVTTLENDNLVACIIAKKLGARQTIARINNIENLELGFKEFFSDLGVDKVISPSLLAAQEIIRLVENSQVTDNFQFEGGKVSLIGITIEEPSDYIGRTILEIKALKQTAYNPIAILRGNETILPRENTRLRRGDHIYFISDTEQVESLLGTIGKTAKKIKRIMILGGNEIGLQTAKSLENDYDITIIESSEKLCKRLVEQLDKTLVLKGDPSNIDLLKEEGLTNMDAIIAVTPNSETNIISCLMAETVGVYKTIALVENLDYTHISQNIGINTIINKKIIAANFIFRYVRKGKIEAITSLHGVDGEVIEYIIQKSNKLTRGPLRTIRFPDKAIIGAVIRDNTVIVPTGDFTLKEEDKVIVLALPDAMGKIEDLFR